MKQLMQLRFFSLIKEKSIHENELNEAYEEFALSLIEIEQTQTNLNRIYYILGYTHLELVGLCENYPNEEEKKCSQILHN